MITTFTVAQCPKSIKELYKERIKFLIAERKCITNQSVGPRDTTTISCVTQSKDLLLEFHSVDNYQRFLCMKDVTLDNVLFIRGKSISRLKKAITEYVQFQNHVLICQPSASIN